MITAYNLSGVYECISKFNEPYYKSIVAGFLYSVTFYQTNDFVEVEDVSRYRTYYIPRQKFFDHFKKVVKDKTLNHKEDAE